MQVDEVERERRERHVREYNRPRELLDPFTWPYRYKGLALIVTASIASAQAYNIWTKKPWFYGLYPRCFIISILGVIGYGLGSLREHHCRTRDAVVDHYISLHPEDFSHLKNLNGRPYSQVLLPWYPLRTYYRKFDD